MNQEFNEDASQDVIDSGEEILAPIPEEGSSGSRLHWLLIVFGACVVALLFYLFVLKSPVSQVEQIDPFKDLRGQVHLTLALEAGDRGGRDFADTNEYVFDFESGTIMPIMLEDDNIEITSDLSNDKKFRTYVAAPYDPETPDEYFWASSEIAELYTEDLSSKEITKLTNDESVGKRHPKWSNSGTMIAYMTANEEVYFNEGPLLDTEDWRIHIFDLEGGSTTIIANGVQPFWSPDDKYILYVNSQGLHRYDIASGENVMVNNFASAPISALMKFYLSDDGSRFAWSYPKGDHITLFEIVSWDPFEMKVLDEIFIDGYAATYYPIFSPDNRYVVYQWVDYDEQTDEFFDFQLRVFDTVTKQRKKLVDLEEFDFFAGFTSDWVY